VRIREVALGQAAVKSAGIDTDASRISDIFVNSYRVGDRVLGECIGAGPSED
jgi:hypothetical protein